MSRIVLVDATNAFIRNYTVVPTLDLNGNRNGGVYGTLTTLAHFCKVCNPDRLIIVWDGPGGSQKRRKLLKGYKDGRKPIQPSRINKNFEFEEENLKENMIFQRSRLAEYINDLPVSQITLDNIEADDVIAYLVHYFKDDEKVIASDDKDFFQLLDKNTIVYRPTSKKLYTNKELLSEFKIQPYNFALARSVAGDTSDNIKGIERVGLKNLIKYFPFMCDEERVTIDSLIKHSQEKLSDKNGAKYQKFIDQKEVIETNYKVIQLYDPIISYSSIDLIIREVEKPLTFNATNFRTKLLVDGITTIGDSFFQFFKKLTFEDKK